MSWFRALTFALSLVVVSVVQAQLGRAPAKPKPAMGAYPPTLIKGLKDEIAARDAKHLPNVIPAELVGPLGFRVPKCSPAVQVANIKACKASTCWDAVPLMGLNSAVQNIVHGVNPQGNCSFSIHTARYFVPKNKLSDFAELYRLGVFWNPNFQAHIAASNGMKKLVTSLRILNQNCGIDLTYDKGKLVSATLQRSAPAICTEKKVTLPYLLEKQGLFVALPSASH
jgi:hypothetical protein